jgi:hypothetical protein
MIQNENVSLVLLSLKFCPHVATRTQHRQKSNEVIHGPEIILQHSKRSKTIQSSEKLKSALQKLGAHAHAQNRNVPCTHTRMMRDC